MEYPFLKPEIVRNCFLCSHDSCFNKKCCFIPGTKINYMGDIVILSKTGSLSQIIEIITTHGLSESKLSFYERKNIPVIVIYSEDLLNYTKLYSNLKCHKIIKRIHK